MHSVGLIKVCRKKHKNFSSKKNIRNFLQKKKHKKAQTLNMAVPLSGRGDMLLMLSIMFHAFPPPVLIAWFLVGTRRPPAEQIPFRRWELFCKPRIIPPLGHCIGQVASTSAHVDRCPSSRYLPEPHRRSLLVSATTTPSSSTTPLPVLWQAFPSRPYSFCFSPSFHSLRRRERSIGLPAVDPLGGVPDLELTICVGRRPAGDWPHEKQGEGAKSRAMAVWSVN